MAEDKLNEYIEKHYNLTKLCRDVFNTGNLIASDFDDIQVFEVKGRDFPQQPNGAGIHVCFSVSWHAIGKTGADAHEAIENLGLGDDIE